MNPSNGDMTTDNFKTSNVTIALIIIIKSKRLEKSDLLKRRHLNSQRR